MATPFALLCEHCGLSQSEAAVVLKISPSSVDKMARGVRSTPPGIIDELRALAGKIDRAADEGLKQIAHLKKQMGEEPTEVELGLASDDHEARSLGWPCAGAHRAVLSQVVARADVPIRIVPRGSTRATALAADAHETALRPNYP